MHPDGLRRLYYQMLRIRMVDEKIAEIYSEQEMRCPVHLSIGQEAIAVGVCAALSTEDYVLSTHRGHAHYLAKGGDLKAMMAELYLRVTGTCQGRGGSMHLVDRSAGFLAAVPIVGSTIPIAVGTALGSVMRNESRVAVGFFGEAATEEGVFHESINFAVLKKLPVVFICENNLYSVYSPLSVRQPEGREPFELARAYGLESCQGDGNDVGQVFELVEKAVAKARAGAGPSFLEFKTYRWREHCGPNYDNDLGYRTENEFLEWKESDPITRLGHSLISEGNISESEIQEIVRDLDAEIEDAFAFAKESPFPGKELLFNGVYAA